jgi:ADP-ribose pyrophosphatase YjhB (NUDIX family)
MTTTRKFCRLSKPPFAKSSELPGPLEDTLCLSAFVLLSEEGRPSTVLMGHLDPRADWEHIGALDPGRVEAHRHGWMLPSSHLMLRESPQEAAQRILDEQLGLGELSLSGPEVFSEVYTPKRFPDLKEHWDLEFVFRGVVPAGTVLDAPAWTALRFVNPANTKRDEITRGHEDILELAGFSLHP